MKLQFAIGAENPPRWSCEFADPGHTRNAGSGVKIACERCNFEQTISWDLWNEREDSLVDSRCKDGHATLIVSLIAGALA